MKLIKLTRGKFAMVDDDDFDRLNKFKWNLIKDGDNYYPRRSIVSEDKCSHCGRRYQRDVKMHREIMNAVPFQIVDHKDGNTLNCQKSNLRFCTAAENSRNKTSKKNSTSIYLGVHKRRGSWIMSINTGSIKIRKTFANEIEAALYYNKKATELFGEFARLNVIQNGPQTFNSEAIPN